MQAKVVVLNILVKIFSVCNLKHFLDNNLSILNTYIQKFCIIRLHIVFSMVMVTKLALKVTSVNLQSLSS